MTADTMRLLFMAQPFDGIVAIEEDRVTENLPGLPAQEGRRVRVSG
ncbi:MAG: hypothetical protein HY645_09910 [Acidobacteria bacterium]|nr:hypothetical protein [Acidobacteriota bacterium]